MLGPNPLPFASEDVQLASPRHPASARKAVPDRPWVGARGSIAQAAAIRATLGQAPAVYLVGI